MKRIVYTKHAEEMLSVRNISKEMVESCLLQPTRVMQARENTRAYLKAFGVNNLKVIATEEQGTVIVVTVYWFAKNRIKQ